MTESFRILIVEDEHIVALDLHDQVKKLGHSVVGIAQSGEQAIELALETRPDLVLMDIRLKGEMDGIDTAIEIRAYRPIPIVYLTAYTDAETLERASVTQPLGYILKPFQLRELETTIQLALYKSKVENELTEYVRQLDLIMRHATDGFVLTDSKANILRMNERAESYLTLLNHDFDQPLRSFGEQAIEELLTDNPSTKTWTVHTPDPAQYLFEITISDEFVSNSSTYTQAAHDTARLFVIRDITLQQRMQQENEDNARMAAIGQLAAGIAHDFNNILGIILTKADIIRMSQPNLTDKSLEHLSGISHHVKRATDLISQVLDFTRSSNLDMNTLNLYPLFNELIKLVRRTLPKTIEIEFKHEGSDFWITGDPTRMSQAIMNLVIRARDAMPHSGQLTVSMDKCDSSQLPAWIDAPEDVNNWVYIQIHDTGESLAEGVISDIFDPLLAPENDLRGLSMQLAQTKGIVEQHEGFIVVSSDESGNRFEIFIPEVIVNEQPESEDKAEAITVPQNTTTTILLVEDDSSLRASMGETLYLLGYSVYTAIDGVDGLNKYLDHADAIDIVITDMIMPNKDGLQLCRDIRNESQDVSLIIVSGYSSHNYEEVEDVNLVTWLNKPVDIEQLDRALKAARKN